MRLCWTLKSSLMGALDSPGAPSTRGAFVPSSLAEEERDEEQYCEEEEDDDET